MVQNTADACAADDRDAATAPDAPPASRPQLEVIHGTADPDTHSCRALPPLRILRPPATEPDYDPPGAVVIPFPDRHRDTVPPRHLRLVRPAPPEPDPAEARRKVLRFALLLTETLSGRRPIRHLTAYTTAEVRTHITRFHQTLRTCKAPTVCLYACNATAPTPDAAEGFLRLRVGPEQFQAVALRLDRRPRPNRPHDPPIWTCTALQYA